MFGRGSEDIPGRSDRNMKGTGMPEKSTGILDSQIKYKQRCK